MTLPKYSWCDHEKNILKARAFLEEAIRDRINCESPEFQVFLNDLPETDFNNIFKSLPAFYEGLMKEKGGKLGNCFVTGMPGSFYGRIFPTRSLDFVHSSASVHWLSQEGALKIPLAKIVVTLGAVSKITPRHGLVEEADVDSFNFLFGTPYDDSDKTRSGQNVANCIRSATEPMLATHFGDAIIPDLFARYANRVAEHLSMEKGHHFLVVFSLTKK
ncbi:Monomethylxanthine methyltransferase 2 [Vitis vinifera]|uniref:Monomethylxanthine methyltransferase 2 n=1 Tax=Vitis vinifera TaxID=29760 RepID=A0A438K5X9_VITVI|nr:Monomethylxanthine methyltransferase 2 [Vitis vinifera]